MHRPWLAGWLQAEGSVLTPPDVREHTHASAASATLSSPALSKVSILQDGDVGLARATQPYSHYHPAMIMQEKLYTIHIRGMHTLVEIA